ncbi:DUF1365 domain-containing protein [Marinimicrobium sp. ABcell2]|uniref:DUF1365 domain-containing protein n=1 Tax=Marinimicrobium sp. ABcell2 TaxID=3069751 RepID=UPI0027B24A99|nr:DUF1365 domain-containing protein [Marinimicrobium sp. ABcell2]MDQ2076799.1 DUF1365 domain-containing protein [Marinimicrobium sp. ABcell2]
MKSAIYTGSIFHQRHRPHVHAFRYRIFLMYLNLSELDQVLKLSRWWSTSRFALARFKREDFHGDPAVPLDDAVRETVFQALGTRPDGDICLLANLRYFGYNMNPLVTYYCFSKAGELQAIVAEVHNTPWNERHAYVIPCDPAAPKQSYHFDKTFTVSPFNPLNMTYSWRSTLPGETLSIRIDNLMDDTCVHSAALSLQRRPISRANLNRVLLSYPLQTTKVIATIYWQALRLWLKKTPFLGKDKTLEQVPSKANVEPLGHEDHRL